MPGDKQAGSRTEMKCLNTPQDDDSCSSNSNDFAYSDCPKKIRLDGDEQSDAQTDMKNWETAEDDDTDSIYSCSSNRSMDYLVDFQTEDPPDDQDLDTESQNSLHEQNPSEEKEREDDDPSGGRNRFTENKNTNDSPYLDFPKVFFSPGHNIPDIRCGRLSA